MHMTWTMYKNREKIPLNICKLLDIFHKSSTNCGAFDVSYGMVTRLLNFSICEIFGQLFCSNCTFHTIYELPYVQIISDCRQHSREINIHEQKKALEINLCGIRRGSGVNEQRLIIAWNDTKTSKWHWQLWSSFHTYGQWWNNDDGCQTETTGLDGMADEWVLFCCALSQ